MLEKEDIKKSIQLAENNRHFEKLNQIYRQIPDGICSGCTNCCVESVHASYTEFLNIYDYLKKNALFYDLLPNLISHYFLEFVEKKYCPFLNHQGKCSIYSVRPLTCRLFGHWEKEDFDHNLNCIHKENKKAALLLEKEYNIKIPENIIEFSIPYCETFRTNKKISKESRAQMNDELFSLDILFLMNECLPENLIGTPLITWFIYTLYHQEKASTLRLKVAREFTMNQRNSITLDKIQSSF